MIRAISIWIIVSLIMILHFFLMLSVGVITTQVRGALGLTALELSFLASSYLYIYLIMQTPSGILMDCYGARNLIALGSVVTGIGCFIFAHSSNLAVAMLGRILCGGGLSFVFVSAVQLANRWFPLRYFGFMIGLIETAAMVGAIAGNMALAVYIKTFGWRDCFNFAGVFSIFMSSCAWLIISDYPKSHVPVAREKLTKLRILENLKFIRSEPQVWLNAMYIFLMYIAITVFSGLWANPFLRKAYDMSLEQSTFACCMVLAGLGIGSPIGGALFNTPRSRALFMQYSPFPVLVCLMVLLYVTLPSNLIVYCMMFLLGISCSSMVQPFTIITNLAPKGMQSTSVGFVNAIALLSPVIFQPFIGLALNLLSDEVGPGGLEYYSANDYRIALSVLPILVVLCIPVANAIAKHLVKPEHKPA